MQTWQAINGFIAGDPTISYNNDGDARLYVRVGINHFEKVEGGSYRKLAPTYHDLVEFGRGAELSHERFRKGDDFVAQGYVREYTRTVDGEQRTSEQFVAHRLVHDPHTTTYEIHRKPRAARRDNTEPTSPNTEHEPAAPAPVSTTPRPASHPGPVLPPPPPPAPDAITR